MKKDNLKKQVVKVAIGCLAIFSFGIFIGYQLDNNMISSIQGYLFNAVANLNGMSATDSNATNANATNSNATNSNATDANATNGNATITDNLLYLQSFSLSSSSAKQGDKVNVSIVTNGACNSDATIIFKSMENNLIFTVSVNSLGNNPYIEIPSNVVTTDYIVTDVLLFGENSDGTKFSKQYSINSGIGSTYFNFNSSIKINEAEKEPEIVPVEPVVLNSILINKEFVNLNDEVGISFKTTKEIKTMKLNFTSSNNVEFSAYVQSLYSNPYFKIPETAILGSYDLTSAIIVSDNETVIFTKTGNEGKKFNFNSKIEIIGNSNSAEIIYNNEDINSEIITNIYNAPDNTKIIINADSNPIINEELFNTIKGTNKKLILNYNGNQIIFLGKDITLAKSIDISIIISEIKESSNIGKLINNGIVINFASNGNLPGKALVRISAIEKIKNILGNNSINVYYYNAASNKFNEIAKDVVITSDNYYEFNISHTSDYVLVNQRLSDELVVEEEENIVNFQKSNKVNLLLILAGIIVVILVSVFIVILKNKQKD